MKKFCVSAVMLVLAGCAADGHRAPVIYDGGEVVPGISAKPASNSSATSGSTRASGDWRPTEYVVKQGDTLYNIALNHGLAYRELAELNGLANPDRIMIGQRLRLFADNGNASVAARPTEVADPVVKPVDKPEVSTKPLLATPEVIAAPLDKVDDSVVKNEPLKPVVANTPAEEAGVKSQPKLVKYPYSEDAVAKAESVQTVVAVTPVKAPVIAAPVEKPVVASAPVAASSVQAAPAVSSATPDKVKTLDDGDGGNLQWSMPTSGKVIRPFSEADNQKGIDIAGKAEPVLASAAGTVVYSGSGLRGYGKLVILKHGKVYISAYAHNDKILVKEGQAVKRGQKIAEMGNSDADQVKLHFEVRRFGKPVDPAKYLPLDNS